MNRSMHADDYVCTLAREHERRFAFQASNQEELEEWQASFRSALVDVLGINRIRERGISDLEPLFVGKTVLDDHIREEWKITSEPGYRVPFYVLRPLTQERPLPVVITPHGHGKAGKDTYAGITHSEEDRRSIVEGERDIALQAVREGYIAIAPDVRAFGETRMKKDIEEDRTCSCRTMQMHALLFGRTLIGERVWDISRLIDYAETRDDMDTGCIVITGNSGGGTVSLFAPAVEERISIAIPSCYFCTFEASIGSIYHCECNYVPGIMTMGEMYDVAGLIAPRPFLAVAGKDDPIFPIAATRLAYSKVRNVYEVAGVPERCELYTGEGGHRYYKERVWPFVARWRGYQKQ